MKIVRIAFPAHLDVATLAVVYGIEIHVEHQGALRVGHSMFPVPDHAPKSVVVSIALHAFEAAVTKAIAGHLNALQVIRTTDGTLEIDLDGDGLTDVSATGEVSGVPWVDALIDTARNVHEK